MFHSPKITILPDIPSWYYPKLPPILLKILFGFHWTSSPKTILHKEGNSDIILCRKNRLINQCLSNYGASGEK
jgi:hypothetical protein